MGSEQQQKNPMHSFLCMGRNIFRGTTQISLKKRDSLMRLTCALRPKLLILCLPAGLHSGSSGGKFVLSSERKEACSR